MTKNKMCVWLQSIDPGRVSEAVNSFYRQKISLICEQSPAVNHDIWPVVLAPKAEKGIIVITMSNLLMSYKSY